jgi:hypothetical protein
MVFTVPFIVITWGWFIGGFTVHYLWSTAEKGKSVDGLAESVRSHMASIPYQKGKSLFWPSQL